MEVRPLHDDDFPAVHAAFLEAFSDYQVPLQLEPAQLREMTTRRGYVPAASVGVFDEGSLVAFTLNGIGIWQGRRCAYDTGTGVVPSHRSRGLSRTMMDAAIQLLRDSGATAWLLEVLTGNVRAANLYRSAGFEVVRELQCWSFTSRGAGGDAARVAAADWSEVRALFDVEPSWQNSVDSVLRARAERVVLVQRDAAGLTGCAVVFPANGDLPFLAIAPRARRKGRGSALLEAAAAAAGGPLRIVNVDAHHDGIARFLESCGATRTVRQYEMLREL